MALFGATKCKRFVPVRVLLQALVRSVRTGPDAARRLPWSSR
jgi:hypothetical protein